MKIKQFLKNHKHLIIFFFVFAAFVSAIVVNVFTTAISYDDAYNVTIAKNIANGYGYVSSYHDFTYFNAEVTTGPTMILPSALLIKIFGNQLWIPQLVPALIFIIGVLVALRLNILQNKRQNFILFSIFIFLLVIFIPASNFYIFLGELPSAILVIISAILLTKLKLKYVFVAGIVFSLAVLTKTIVMLFLPSAILGLCLYYFINNGVNKTSIISIIKLTLTFILGFALIYGSYIFAKGMFTPNIELAPNAITEKSFFIKASGLRNLIDSEGYRAKLQYIEKNIQNSFNSLSKHLGSETIAISSLALFFVMLIASIIRAIIKRKFDKFYIAITALGINIFLHFVWWFMISHDGWVRHLFQIIVYIAFLAAIYIVVNIRKYKLIVPVLVIITIIILLRSNGIRDFFDFSLDPRYIPLEQTTEFLMNLKDQNPNIIFAGCGWWANRDLEYSLSSVLNFRNCYHMDQEYLDNNEVYLVRSEIYNWGNEVFINKFTELCDQEVIYENQMFKISRCYKRPI